MKILITGAGGFVGQILASELLKSPSNTVILTDIFEPPIPPKSLHPENATTLSADLSSPSSLSTLLPGDLSAIFIFHGIMSAGSESDFELGYRVNLFSTLNLLEAIRKTYPRGDVRVIYASSTAIFGQPLPSLPNETTAPTPQGSYGTQKAMIELAINDYTRRGYFHGLTLRFPTISVRPGKPTQAASSWMSGIIREPLQGKESVLPCPDGFEAWLCSPKTLVRNLVHALGLPRDCLPSHTRQVLLPGITANVRDMLAALKEVGGEEAVGLVRREEPTKEIKDLLDSWPTVFDCSRALGLGFQADQDFIGAVRDFQEGLKGE